MATENLERTLLTTVETAERLGYTIQHTRLLIRQNRLPAQKVGRDWLIFEDDLWEFIKVRGVINN